MPDPEFYFFCPTRNLELPPDQVHVGTKSTLHIMRIMAKCPSCPGRAVPHLVETRLRQETR